MSLTSKALMILAVLAAAIYYDLPTVHSFMPEEPGAQRARIESRYKEIKRLVEPLKAMHLALAEPDQNRIQLLVGEGARVPMDNPIFAGLVQDRFELKEIDGSNYLVLKPEFTKETFVSKVAKELDGLFTNVRKIETIQLAAGGDSILISLKKTRRLGETTEPLKSILGSDLEAFYKEEGDAYQLRPKELANVVSLGLDLQGGMYLDVGVEVDVVAQKVVERAAEALELKLLENHVNYDSVLVTSERQIEVSLSPDENLDLASDDYARIVGADFDIKTTPVGRLLSMKPEADRAVKQRAIEQALETIRNRIDQLGVKEPSIQRRGEDSIIVQLPGLKDPDQARRVIGQVAVLDFQLVTKNVTPETATDEHIVRYQEVRDETTKEVINRVPYVLEKKVLLQGDVIRDARVGFGQTGQAYVSISFDAEGKEVFGKVTGETVGRQLAIVLDGKVQSAPRINEKIDGGEAQITGSFSPEEASELALVLRSGALPAPIVIHEERTIGASLGQDSIRQALVSLVIGFSIVMIFMVVYYRVAGVFAVLALVGNLSLIVAALAYFQATLTLPGMAGIVLTIGMAVDANVLIFERIREELRKGTNHRSAIQIGFAKATTTILDSNITTILAAIILFQFGTGPIKGFAVTLSIGIVASMFTAIIVGKFLFELVYLNRSRLDKISI
ncbi:MAG: protein translocase subunit SecD [bacterium]|nr:protein translocase subunit SecD [bacterium]